jgi:DNA-binding MarR family transcriptional regulator
MATRRQQATLRADAQRVVECCIGANLRMAARRVSQFLDAQLRPSGLSFAQFGLMAQIAAAEDDTIGGLASALGLDQSTLSRNLRLLERDGWVEIVTAEQDLRRRAVWLTERGARRLQQAMPLWRAAQSALAEGIDAAAVLALARAAARLPGEGG